MFDRLEDEVEAREQSLGLKMTDLLLLPEALSDLLNWMIREEQVTCAEIIAFVGQGEAPARALLAEGLGKGYIREIEMHGVLYYRVRMAPKRRSGLAANLWQALEASCEQEKECEP
jgi:hypothetical protein